MMRNVLFLLLLVLSAQAQERPSFEEVLKRFHSLYQYNPGEPSQEVWEKHPEGWFFTIHSFGPQKGILKRVLFWDAESGQYQKLDFDAAPEFRNPDGLVSYMMRQEGETYSLQPFYGYAGWEDDVIDLYKFQAERLTDNELYALARAYSSKATSLIEARGAVFQDPKRCYISGPNDRLSDEEATVYRIYREDARSAFRELSRRDPNYPTPVGEPALKASHEIMTAYLDLRQFYSYGSAKGLMERNLYKGAILAEAVNRLNSCPPNAILFTNGDNDTYPLYYAQEFWNTRPDVRVLNRSLMNLPSYLNFYREAHGEQSALNFGVSPEEMASEASKALMYRPDSNIQSESIDWPDLLQWVTKAENRQLSPMMEAWLSPVPFVNVNYRGQELRHRITSESRAKWVELSLMHYNDVPICYEGYTEGGALMELRKRLRRQGLVYVLDTVEREVPYGGIGTLDFEETERLMLEEFRYHTGDYRLASSQAVASRMRLLFASVILSSPDSTYFERSLALFRKAQEAIPPQKFPHQGEASLQLATAGVVLGQYDQSQFILDQLKAHQEEVIATKPDRDKKQRAEFLLNQVYRLQDYLDQGRQ